MDWAHILIPLSYVIGAMIGWRIVDAMLRGGRRRD